MRTLLQDVRYGFRTLWKSRGYSLVAVLSLALGIGANTTIFSMVNALLIRPLPYADPERLVVLAETQLWQGIEEGSLSVPNFVDWREQASAFEGMSAFYDQSFNLAGEHEPERIEGTRVSANLFTLLGVNPFLGRSFLPEEDKPGAPPVALISHSLWQRRFGSDTEVVGKTIRMNGKPYTLIGVMPARFNFPDTNELWTPMTLRVNEEERGEHYMRVIARLKQGVSREQAATELTTIARRLEEQYPETNSGRGAVIQSLREDAVGEEVRLFMSILLGAVGFVLLIACANVANLLLARAAARQKEIAIRTALGASRFRIVRQLLTESMLVALIGGLSGTLIAAWSLDLLVAQVPEELPFWIRFDIDGRVLAATLVVSMLTGLIFGLAPALQASKPDLNASLKEGGRSSTEGIRRNRLRSLLVVSEVALALVLLIGATLMIKSFLHVQRTTPGFDPQGVLTMQLSVEGPQYADKKEISAFYQSVEQRLTSLPGVQAVGATSALPLGGNNTTTSFVIEGRPVAPGAEHQAGNTKVTERYFEAIGIPLLKGRTFTERDGEEASPVAIINETMVRRFFPDEEPIGKRIKQGNSAESPWIEIVGVVGDVKRQELIEQPEHQLYFPHRRNPWSSMTVVVRTANDPAALSAAVRREIWSVDKDQPIYSIRTMERVIAESEAVWLNRLFGMLFGILAAVALVLAVVGVYGVISYSVSRRTHEIGIRMALGAQTRDVLKLVVGQGLILISIGVAIGLVGALAVTRVMASLLYGVSATDPITFVTISLLLITVALLASYIPARRATKVDPTVSLRYE